MEEPKQMIDAPEAGDGLAAPELITQQTGLMETPDSRLGVFTEERANQIVEEAERKIACAKRLIVAALHMTKSHDWHTFGEKPYLQGEGALRMLAVGVKVSAPVFETHQEGDDFFSRCTVRADWFLGQSVCEIGNCNTRDKFYANDSAGSQLNKIREQCAGNEALARRALKDFVEKKALSNAYSRAITAVMGIRGYDWDDLAEAGLTRGKGATIDFKKPGDTGSKPAARKAASGGGRKKAPPATEGTLADLLVAELGSHISFEAAITGGRQFEKFAIVTVVDGGDTVDLKYWCTETPEWAQAGSVVKLTVEAGEYPKGSGKPDYTIRQHP